MEYLLFFSGYKILVITAQPCDISSELNEIYYLVVVPSILVHSYLCSTWNAIVRRSVQF